MASNEKKKKPSIDDLLTQDIPQGPIRRGAGMKTSFEEANQVHPIQPVEDDAQSHNRTNARVNRGYKLREDLIKRCKQLALNEGRKLYEVMEEALEEYLNRKEMR